MENHVVSYWKWEIMFEVLEIPEKLLTHPRGGDFGANSIWLTGLGDHPYLAIGERASKAKGVYINTTPIGTNTGLARLPGDRRRGQVCIGSLCIDSNALKGMRCRLC